MSHKDDKIINNSFNTGTADNIITEPLALSEYYKRTYFKKEYSPQENYQLDKLIDLMIEILKDTKYYEMLADQKDIKNNLSNILELLLLELENHNEYSFTEKFYCICEIIPIQETHIYKTLPFKYKNMALEELNENYIKMEEKYESIKLF